MAKMKQVVAHSNGQIVLVRTVDGGVHAYVAVEGIEEFFKNVGADTAYNSLQNLVLDAKVEYVSLKSKEIGEKV